MKKLKMDTKPKFNDEFAKELLGKKLLIGMTHQDKKKNILKREQFYGEILRANQKEGIVILRNDTKKEYALPPDFGSIKKAPPGEYNLHSTGEIVVNPDYLTTWTITSRRG